VDITIYLPDELGERAKRETINFSRMLRDALVAHFEEVDTVTRTLENAEEVVLALEDAEGRRYKGRFTAARLSDSDDPEVYLTTDGTVVLYRPGQLRYTTAQNPEEDLRGLLSDENYVAVMDALGIEATVDLSFE
jgi:post-segregation antitoxin (ccd killing protein)